MLATRYYIISGDETYLERAKGVYQWIRTVGIFDIKTGDVYDGVDVRHCNSAKTTKLYSYNYGMLAGAASYLYKATGNATYINDAHLIFLRAKQLFTANNVWTDTCEPNLCDPTYSKPKGTAMMGFTYLYLNSNDSSYKSLIYEVMYKSVLVMMTMCDDVGNCSDDWNYGNIHQSTSFHSQVNSLTLMNAITAIQSASSLYNTTKLNISLLSNYTSTNFASGSLNVNKYVFYSAALLVGFAVFLDL